MNQGATEKRLCKTLTGVMDTAELLSLSLLSLWLLAFVYRAVSLTWLPQR